MMFFAFRATGFVLAATVAVPLVIAGCGGGSSSGPSNPQPTTAPTAAPTTSPTNTPLQIGVETVVTGAEFPSALAFAPSSDASERLFYAELQTGRIRIIENGQLRAQAFATLPVVTQNEQGLLGLAFDPDYASNRFVYAYHTAPAQGDQPARNRVVRFTDTGNQGANLTVIVDDLPTNNIHVGGRIGFGADGKLYVTIGDVGNPANSQNASVRAGKLLRFNADGSIPGDNPTANSATFALGLRNPFGLAFQPGMGTPFVSENGPNCDDEINRIVSGGNYGWRPGDACGVGDDGAFIAPVARFNPSISPTGMDFYEGGVFPEFEGQLFMTSFNDSALRRFSVGSDGSLTQQQIITDARFNRLIDVKVGPDGNIYLATSNAIFRLVRQ